MQQHLRTPLGYYDVAANNWVLSCITCADCHAWGCAQDDLRIWPPGVLLFNEICCLIMEVLHTQGAPALRAAAAHQAV